MRSSQCLPQNTFYIARPARYPKLGAYVWSRLRSKALILLLAVFMICAFYQTVQINILLAQAASVRESVAELSAEQESLASGRFAFQQD